MLALRYRLVRAGSIAAAMILPWVMASPVSAQTASPSRMSSWEIEVFVGAGRVGNSGGGTGQLPAAGPTFLAANGQPTRAATSWYFGDGAALLNAAVASSPLVPAVTARLSPLDSVLTKWPAQGGLGTRFGVRISRPITSRLTAEFSVEVGRGQQLSDASLQSIEASRTSFIDVFNQFFVPSSFLVGRTVTSISTLPSSRRQYSAVGGVVFAIPARSRLQLFVAADVGVSVPVGGALKITMVGDYRYSIAFTPVHDNDSVTIRVDPGGVTPLVQLGGGVKWPLSATKGLRADVRVSVSRHAGRVTLDATPSTFSTLGGVIFPTTPPLQFSGTVRSSLTGPSVAAFETFAGSGNNVGVGFTVGYFFKF